MAEYDLTGVNLPYNLDAEQSVLGAVLMGAITNAMTLMRLQSEWQFLVKGLIIIGAVAIGAISERMAVRKAVRAKEAETKAAA